MYDLFFAKSIVKYDECILAYGQSSAGESLVQVEVPRNISQNKGYDTLSNFEPKIREKSKQHLRLRPFSGCL